MGPDPKWNRRSHLPRPRGGEDPLVLLGGITSGEVIGQAMDEGFQFVAMGRVQLRGPDLVSRMQADASARSRCTHCNKCMTTIFAKTSTRCVLVSGGIPRPAESAVMNGEE